MKRLKDLFAEKPRTFSFELFPPKTEKGLERLLDTLVQLTALRPDFISVTYGAGGGSRDKTLDIVRQIQERHRVIGVAHLTCVCHTKQEIRDVVQSIRAAGINNILALRGDPPKDNPDWQPTEDNYAYSYQLVEAIRQDHGDFFSIGVAGFPEGHILCPDRETDARHLKNKIDAGADFVITQLFFDNKDYFEYRQRLDRLGVKTRVIPGIIPIVDYQGLVKFCEICGATIPDHIHKTFIPLQGDKEKTKQAGIEYCIRQCRQLLDGGAPGIHFYVLNKSHPIDVILPEIRATHD